MLPDDQLLEAVEAAFRGTMDVSTRQSRDESRSIEGVSTSNAGTDKVFFETGVADY